MTCIELNFAYSPMLFLGIFCAHALSMLLENLLMGLHAVNLMELFRNLSNAFLPFIPAGNAQNILVISCSVI